MSRSTLLSGLLAVCTGLPLLLSANCEPGPNTLRIKQANGVSIYLGATTSEQFVAPLISLFDHYGTIYLGPGDTLLVIIHPDCSNLGELSRNGNAQPPTSTVFMGDWTFKCTLAGAYQGGNCEMACNLFDFTIAPLATAQGPARLRPSIILDGATTAGTSSHSMRTDLKTAGLLPQAEPYSAMGYTFLGGGGETLTANALARPLVDWVIVELRSTSQPTVVVASQAALVLSYGAVINSDGGDLNFNVAPGYYYVAFKHRNHLGVMTAQPVLLVGPPLIVDMTNSLIPAYGTEPMKPSGLRFRLWSGNAVTTVGTQQIKYAGVNNDRDAVLNRVGGSVPTGTASGYLREDVNLDGVVKYAGAANDRDVILTTIGGSVPTATRNEQVP
ncbi:MAG: hypothetical protein KA175_12675 [Flavobacteriales bacterium]|nr:hypothetical protein [Flavobacteriales bacterium]